MPTPHLVIPAKAGIVVGMAASHRLRSQLSLG
jgi:hypothetical protein